MPQWFVEWRRSLTFKLMVSYLLAWGLAAALVGTVIGLVLQFQPVNSSLRNAQRLTQLLGDALVFDAQGKPQRIDGIDQLGWLSRSLPEDFSYQISDRQGRVFLSSAPAGKAMPEPPTSTSWRAMKMVRPGTSSVRLSTRICASPLRSESWIAKEPCRITHSHSPERDSWEHDGRALMGPREFRGERRC